MDDRERLQQWMRAQNVSQSALAKRLGLSRAMVSYLLSGTKGISPNFKWRFRQALGNEAADAVFGAPQVVTQV